MNVPENLKYAESHEWARPEGGEAVVGITDFAQHELTDIVFVDLPQVGREIAKGEALAVVESVKAVSDIYAPVGGTVIAVNDELANAPDLVNTAPFEGGWIARIKMSNPADLDALMTPEQYKAHIAGKG
jgi:glycine cleavage system H protein